MKKIILVFIVLTSSCIYIPAQAQVSIHVNLGIQPEWGPVGYDYVNYYYIPDIEAYYNVQQQQYTYYDDGRWITTQYLPPRYSNFDLYNAHKVVINESNPWIHNDRYRGQYGQYRGRHDQYAIRDSRDQRYYENPNHPMHGQWHGNNGYEDRGHGNQGRGNQGYGNQGRGYQGHGDQGYGYQGHGNQGRGDQGRGNQGYGNQGRADQGHGNQGRGDQGRGDQGHGNQGRGDQGHGNQGHGNGGQKEEGHGH